MKPERFPKVIAAHECGHVVALAAAGLADEFLYVTIVPQNNALGVTKRTGASLTELGYELDIFPVRINAATGEAQQRVTAEFNDFIATTPDVCLPHLCFFFGGGSLDRLLGRENANRNSIDADCIRNMVMPSMVLKPSWADHLREVQEKVDEFLFPVFEVEENEQLFEQLFESLLKRKALTRADLDPDIRDEMNECAERSKKGYEELLVWFRQWHSRHRLHF